MNRVGFRPFTAEDIPLYLKWAKVEHVKNTWFLEGYEPPELIYDKVKGNGYDYPYIITLDDKPIGYIVYCDLYAYKTLCVIRKGVFTDEPPGTYCLDLFIADPLLFGKGYGTQVVTDFSNMLLAKPGAKRVLIDPSANNARAIRCYEKAGFKPIRLDDDGTSPVLILEKSNA